MFLLFEMDKHWAGIGIDWFPHIKGVRLGWVAVHIILTPFNDFMDMMNKHYHTMRLKIIEEEARKEAEKVVSYPIHPGLH